MDMAIPIFLYFSVVTNVYTYLPLFLRNMGYSATAIGFLLAVYEVCGAIFPFFICRMPTKNGKYGLFLLFFSFLLMIMPFPLFLLPTIGTVVCIGIYAIAARSMVPISDSYINLKLGVAKDKYGMVRSFGALGSVVTNLVMQYFVRIDSISLVESALWMTVPAMLLCFSLIVIPDLLKTHAPEKNSDISKDTSTPDNTSNSNGFFAQFPPLFWLMIAVLTLGMFGQSPSTRFFSLYVKEYLHSDSFAILWAFSALVEIPFMFFSYRFIRRFGSQRLIIFCVLMVSVRNLSYVIFPSIAGATFGQMLNCFTYGLLLPAAVMFVAEQVKDKKTLL